MNRKNQFVLNDGSTLPYIGLGTIGIKGSRGIQDIVNALNMGYRLIDTSTNYNNEGMIGEAIRRSQFPREQILVSAKLPGVAHEYDRAIELIQESLYRMGLDYFDKYLIHWPNPKTGKYGEAWKALVEAQKFGLINTIGVSNFEPEHLEKIIDETGVIPATNQIERHPYFNNDKLVRANNELGILTEAWSPFGRDIYDTLSDETIVKIAKKYGKDPAQIILNWNHQDRVLPIAKSASLNNQMTNFESFDFELTKEEIDEINSLDQGESGRVEGQNPHEYEEFV